MTRWFVAAALLLSPSLAFAQCSEVPGQGFYCKTLMTMQGGIELPATTTIANLPVCNAASQGQIRMVSDATAPTYNGVLTGGGAVVIMTFCNGTAWLAH
jgi:hypothetical protein